VSSREDGDAKLKAICKLLKDNVSYYDWVGFYFVDKKKQKELLLGPFVGEPTEHIRIPFGRGICGQAAELRKAFVVRYRKGKQLPLLQHEGEVRNCRSHFQK